MYFQSEISSLQVILQRGNPLLKFITSVPWEYDDIIPDYEVGKTICILFLSLRYHNLNPDYINNRLKELGKKYELRVLLVQVTIKIFFSWFVIFSIFFVIYFLWLSVDWP